MPATTAAACSERDTRGATTTASADDSGRAGGIDHLTVPVRMIDPELPVPGYRHDGDAGADLAAAEDVVLQPGERRVVGTGVAVALPTGYAGFVHPRSGLAARHGLGIVNAPGTVDAGYRGEIRVCLVNTDRHSPITLRRGDRIAQLVVQRVAHAEFVPVETLPPSERGERGYGSTGGFSSATPSLAPVTTPERPA